MKKYPIKKLPKEVLLEKRKEVIRLHKASTPVMQIVKTTGLSWPAVNVAINLYKEGGEEAVSLAKRGRKQGTGRLLSQDQEDDIRNILYRKRPWQVGLKHLTRNTRIHLWDRNLVKRFIYQKVGINLSERGLAKYLHRWGFPLMKKNQRPTKRCKREIQKWLAVNYASLKKRIEAEYADIYWVSRRRVVIQDGSALKWPKPVSMISAIDNQGLEYWIMIRGYFKQEKQISFLKSLLNHAHKRIFVVRDNNDHYKGSDISRWLRENKESVEIFPSPPD